jgi:cyclic beta-1,2-glucan synthetase
VGEPPASTQRILGSIQDKDDGRLWSIGREPPGMVEATRVVFHQHQVEFHRSDHGIAVSMEVGIPPGDDLEIRRITVVNETGRPRRLALTSYAEVVLGPCAITNATRLSASCSWAANIFAK